MLWGNLAIVDISKLDLFLIFLARLAYKGDKSSFLELVKSNV